MLRIGISIGLPDPESQLKFMDPRPTLTCTVTKQKLYVWRSAVDLHRFDADSYPDPMFHVDASPDLEFRSRDSGTGISEASVSDPDPH